MKNSLYRNTEFSLSFKTKLNHSSSYIMKKGPKYLTSSIHSNSRLTTKKTRTASTGKNDNNSSKSRLNQLTSSYEHLHWKDVTSKAGIINNDSPYLPDEEYVKQQYRENKKRWINKQNFNVFVGKATSNKAYMIKNYVQMTPSIPPVLHSFRPIHKEKWISKKGFMVF